MALWGIAERRGYIDCWKRGNEERRGKGFWTAQPALLVAVRSDNPTSRGTVTGGKEIPPELQDELQAAAMPVRKEKGTILFRVGRPDIAGCQPIAGRMSIHQAPN